MSGKRTFQQDVSVVLAGEAGQGIATIEQVLMRVLKAEGYYVSATKEYMSRVRGGTNTTEIRVTSLRSDRLPVALPALRLEGVVLRRRARLTHPLFVVECSR